MLSKLTGVDSVCCLNVTGRRYRDLGAVAISNRMDQFRHILARMALPIDGFWLDNDRDHHHQLQTYCKFLADLGELRCRTETTLVCRCGSVEVLQIAVDAQWTMDWKVLGKNAGELFCTLCNSRLQETRGPRLLLESSSAPKISAVLPSFYETEIGLLRGTFLRPILVSRQRKLGPRISLFGRQWRLDTDFCWSFVFCSLVKKGTRTVAVVASNRSMRQLVWSLGISQKLVADLDQSIAIVTPFIELTTTTPEAQLVTVDDLVDRYGRMPIRMLLARCLQWDRKEVQGDLRTIFWTLKALEREHPIIRRGTTGALSLTAAIKQMNGSQVDRLIAALRKDRPMPVSEYHERLLS